MPTSGEHSAAAHSRSPSRSRSRSRSVSASSYTGSWSDGGSWSGDTDAHPRPDAGLLQDILRQMSDLRSENKALRAKVDAIDSSSLRLSGKAKAADIARQLGSGALDFRGRFTPAAVESKELRAFLDFSDFGLPRPSDPAVPATARPLDINMSLSAESLEDRRSSSLMELLTVPRPGWLPVGGPVCPPDECLSRPLRPEEVRRLDGFKEHISIVLCELRGVEAVRQSALAVLRAPGPSGAAPATLEAERLAELASDSVALLGPVSAVLESEVAHYLARFRELLEPLILWSKLKLWLEVSATTRARYLALQDLAGFRACADPDRCPWGLSEVRARIEAGAAAKQSAKLGEGGVPPPPPAAAAPASSAPGASAAGRKRIRRHHHGQPRPAQGPAGGAAPSGSRPYSGPGAPGSGGRGRQHHHGRRPTGHGPAVGRGGASATAPAAAGSAPAPGSAPQRKFR